MGSGMIDNESLAGDSPGFYFMAWISFGLAATAMLVGIWYIPMDTWVRAFLGTGYIFSLSACFTLAKTLRDRHEHQRRTNRISHAATEKILREHDSQRAA